MGPDDICKRPRPCLTGAWLFGGPVSHCETGQFGGDPVGAYSITTPDACADLAGEAVRQSGCQQLMAFFDYVMVRCHRPHMGLAKIGFAAFSADNRTARLYWAFR